MGSAEGSVTGASTGACRTGKTGRNDANATTGAVGPEAHWEKSHCAGAWLGAPIAAPAAMSAMSIPSCMGMPERSSPHAGAAANGAAVAAIATRAGSQRRARISHAR